MSLILLFSLSRASCPRVFPSPYAPRTLLPLSLSLFRCTAAHASKSTSHQAHAVSSMTHASRGEGERQRQTRRGADASHHEAADGATCDIHHRATCGFFLLPSLTLSCSLPSLPFLSFPSLSLSSLVLFTHRLPSHARQRRRQQQRLQLCLHDGNQISECACH